MIPVIPVFRTAVVRQCFVNRLVQWLSPSLFLSLSLSLFLINTHTHARACAEQSLNSETHTDVTSA